MAGWVYYNFEDTRNPYTTISRHIPSSHSQQQGFGRVRITIYIFMKRTVEERSTSEQAVHKLPNNINK